MARKIFVNLPVKDMERSQAFFRALGFSFNPQFTNEQGACMVISEDIYAMLLVEPFFQTFTKKPVADATKKISEVLDASDVMGEQPYTLEVTSRGVDRPLTLPRHWRRNAGRLVKVTTPDGETLTGRITASDDDAVTLDVDGEARLLPYAGVTKALVQVEFNRKTDDGED